MGNTYVSKWKFGFMCMCVCVCVCVCVYVCAMSVDFKMGGQGQERSTFSPAEKQRYLH